jgi:transposase
MPKEWLPKRLEANDDLTLEEHRQAFEEEFGQGVSTSTIGRAISSLLDGGWSLKKSHRLKKSVMNKPEGCGGGWL